MATGVSLIAGGGVGGSGAIGGVEANGAAGGGGGGKLRQGRVDAGGGAGGSGASAGVGVAGGEGGCGESCVSAKVSPIGIAKATSPGVFAAIHAKAMSAAITAVKRAFKSRVPV